MKKLLTFAALFALIAFTSCKYDDDDLWNSVHGLEDRVTKLEELCRQMNTNISSLQNIVTALQNNDYVTGVTPVVQNGKEVGYTIVFSKSNPITIYHGKDGKDGADGVNGADGTDGRDGVTPVIGVRQDTDGVYYWTLNGEWLTDEHGDKIKAEGRDGKDGADGANGSDGNDGNDGNDGADGKDGKDGITPQFKIENDYWFISYDKGNTWTQLGKATGDDGQNGADGIDGDSMFSDVDYTTSSDYVVLTLADGTQIKLPTWSAFEALQRLCNETNTNLKALQAIVNALQNNDWITSVDPLTENGKVVGYTIKFAKSNPIVIYNGKDGAAGADGNTPVIGVKKDADGIYYWTLDGEFIVVDGQKIKAQGTDGNDGADGSDGTNGKDGITPKLEIRAGYWWISYDNGANWTQLDKATGEDGKDADSIKITQDEDNVYFELADGTVITIPKTGQTINPDVIQFEDENVKKLCVAIWDTDGDHELSYDEAAVVTTLGTAFKGNTEIQLFNELKYFTGLTALDDTFNGCSALWRVTIPANVEAFSSTTFEGCVQLKRVVFEPGSKLTVIPAHAFDSLMFLNAIEIPASVEIIERSAFYWCRSLATVTFEKGSCLKTIGEEAFSGCTALTSIEIPASVETIESGAIGGCISLSSVTFEKGSHLITIEGYRDDSSQYGAFGGCTALTSIEIPASVETIEARAFQGCTSLISVTFEKGSQLKIIGGAKYYMNTQFGAFYGLKKLTTVDMSECTHVESIGEYAFYGTSLSLFKIGTMIPPVCANSAFNPESSTVLKVPSGCVGAYKEAEGWNRFKSYSITVLDE